MADLDNKTFQAFSELIMQKLGIVISHSKKELLQTRLVKLMRNYNIDNFLELYTQLKNKGIIWTQFVDEITIHKTDFFRENNHFDFLKTNISKILKLNSNILRENKIRIWSAGCSSGEEAYTIAMVLKEALPPAISMKILATDVSVGILQKAQKAEYNSKNILMPDKTYIDKYFIEEDNILKVRSEIRNHIIFRQFNLRDAFPFNNKFDIIFCRNVMIYFSREMQQQLITRFYSSLNTGGLLFIGHSESLTGKEYQFKYLVPTVYMRGDIRIQ